MKIHSSAIRPPSSDLRRCVALVVVCLAQLMIVLDSSLESNESDEEEQRKAAESESVHGRPSRIGRRHDRVDADHHRCADQDRARDVHPAAQADALVLVDQPPAEQESPQADGKVDEEDPVPVDQLG